MKGLWAVAFAMLLAGCVVEDDADEAEGGGDESPGTQSPGGPGQGFAPQQGTAHGSFQGIDVDVAWGACDAGFCANATATNHGSQTVRISSICQPPWDERMTHEGDDVMHREAQVTCMAYGRKDFAPGEEAQANFTWDIRLYEDGGASRPAPEGSYTWSIVFWWEDAEESQQEATADIHLVVGET